MEVPNCEMYRLAESGWCPNNPECPLLVYREVFSPKAENLAELFESLFAENGWPPAWRYTIYDFAHYHSTSHEVIGVFRGRATVRFGDGAGLVVDLAAGDVVVIPAGVSHQRLTSSDGFEGVGAYPEDCEPDQIRRESGDEKEAAVARIRALPVPPKDPVGGEKGPIHWQWRGN